ncbi:MAG: hypothetical protein JWQ12_1533 [Glaciihabitans sp.]|nr:hypothetical protein [Glaciihabitans sp.]
MIPSTSDLIFANNAFNADHFRRNMARAAAAGTLHRTSRGVYIAPDLWANFTPRERYLARVVGIAATRRTGVVLSHWTAAAFWGLPNIDRWDDLVHTTISPSLGTRSRNDVVRHSARLDDADVVEYGGHLVTTVARTVLDIAATARFLSAVTVADRALLVDRFGRTPPMVTRAELEEAWERAQPMRAHSRSRAVLAFAETRSESPLESVSRVNMRVIGAPRPELQRSFYDGEGFIGDCDFYWPVQNVIGESDGDSKYLVPSFRAGRTADQVVLDEKIREDRFRATGRGFTRWRWEVAVNPSRLRTKLAGAGLPMGLRW